MSTPSSPSPIITSRAPHDSAPSILVTTPLARSALDRLLSTCHVTYRPTITTTTTTTASLTLSCAKLTDDEMRQACQQHQFQGLVVFAWSRIDASLMDICLPHLKCISTSSVGYDHIDIPAATQRNIIVGYTPGVLTETCADLTVGLLLATSRRLIEAVQVAKAGQWGFFFSKDVHSSTVGFVGLGRIGLAVARRLRAFNCRIIYSSPREKREDAKSVDAEYVSFDELLRTSDFVIPQCPLNHETRGLFGKQAFSKMKSDAIFINTTRGGVVDQDALYDALKNGTILAAGLDVTDPEPLPQSHPLFTLPNCVILPHIASATLRCRANMAHMSIDNLLIALNVGDREGIKGTYVNKIEKQS